jgi:ubiquinone/menaquinone biosynthesis C-methylase UbiE
VFEKSAAFYDAIYGFKDYAGEAKKLHALVEARKHSAGRALLDVACGTGAHMVYLRAQYDVEGLDVDEGLLEVARERLPDVTFHRGDMVDFALGREFDVVTCLFSSIGYVRTEARMRKAIANMGRHLRPGGVLVVEPWFEPGVFKAGRVDAMLVEQAELKIARMNTTSVEGELSIVDFHYMVGTPEGIETFTERHELGMFGHEAYTAAFEEAGLDVEHDAEGLTGRGLYVGRK